MEQGDAKTSLYTAAGDGISTVLDHASQAPSQRRATPSAAEGASRSKWLTPTRKRWPASIGKRAAALNVTQLQSPVSISSHCCSTTKPGPVQAVATGGSVSKGSRSDATPLQSSSST